MRDQATRSDPSAPDQLEPSTDRVVEEVSATNVRVDDVDRLPVPGLEIDRSTTALMEADDGEHPVLAHQVVAVSRPAWVPVASIATSITPARSPIRASPGASASLAPSSRAAARASALGSMAMTTPASPIRSKSSIRRPMYPVPTTATRLPELTGVRGRASTTQPSGSPMESTRLRSAGTTTRSCWSTIR